MINLTSQQKGTFTIEFAIIGVFFSLLLIFSADVVVKLTVKGKLDRISYSAVNIIKERTQFFNAEMEITAAQAADLEKIISDSLSRTVGNFDRQNLSVIIEELRFPSKDHVGIINHFQYNSIGQCAITNQNAMMRLRDLSVITVWGRRTSLYRVTVCYQTNNWVGDLLNVDFTQVSSNAVGIGR